MPSSSLPPSISSTPPHTTQFPTSHMAELLENKGPPVPTPRTVVSSRQDPCYTLRSRTLVRGTPTSVVTVTGCPQRQACFPLLSLPQSLALVLTPQANPEILPVPAPAQFLAAFPGQGLLPAAPSFPRGQAHMLPPNFTLQLWEAPPRANPSPDSGRQEPLRFFKKQSPFEKHTEFHCSLNNLRGGCPGPGQVTVHHRPTHRAQGSLLWSLSSCALCYSPAKKRDWIQIRLSSSGEQGAPHVAEDAKEADETESLLAEHPGWHHV